MQALDDLSPYWAGEARRSAPKSRAGIRATTADRLPLIGPLPRLGELVADRQNLERQSWKTNFDAYAQAGIYVACGYGSRGFTWAPWAADLLTAVIFEDPIPARLESLGTTVPNRQILRKLKRNLL